MREIYKDRLRGVYLYGSYARRQQGPESDLDILIILDEIADYGKKSDGQVRLFRVYRSITESVSVKFSYRNESGAHLKMHLYATPPSTRSQNAREFPTAAEAFFNPPA